MQKFEFAAVPKIKTTLKSKIMKKLVLVSICVLSLALAGSAATTKQDKAPVKKEAPAAKKDVKKAPAKKVVAKKIVKKDATTPAPVKK